jgi:hypothetical protein
VAVRGGVRVRQAPRMAVTASPTSVALVRLQYHHRVVLVTVRHTHKRIRTSPNSASTRAACMSRTVHTACRAATHSLLLPTLSSSPSLPLTLASAQSNTSANSETPLLYSTDGKTPASRSAVCSAGPFPLLLLSGERESEGVAVPRAAIVAGWADSALKITCRALSRAAPQSFPAPGVVRVLHSLYTVRTIINDLGGGIHATLCTGYSRRTAHFVTLDLYHARIAAHMYTVQNRTLVQCTLRTA